MTFADSTPAEKRGQAIALGGQSSAAINPPTLPPCSSIPRYSFSVFPIVVFVFFRIARSSHLAAAGWLVFASLFFYGWWNPSYVLLLIASVAFNYASGFGLARLVRAGTPTLSRALLALAVTANLALLGYYKYANFFLQVAADLSGHPSNLEHILLPLGISFFTFTQIAFLVDVYRGFALYPRAQENRQ
jgi:alginate O-acetyltransferase complex protein AlgI